jgi:hypothetical protein
MLNVDILRVFMLSVEAPIQQLLSLIDYPVIGDLRSCMRNGLAYRVMTWLQA